MKIKKSKFAKLLTLALPIAAISIVTPVVLTSCGSSNSTTTPDKPDNGGTGDGGTSGGGTSGGDTGGSGSETPSVVTASWDNSKFDSNIKLDANKNPIVTLTDTNFASTGLTKMSKFSAIKTSLNPTSASTKTNSTSTTNEETTPAPTTTLFSLLSKAITNIDKFDVSLSLDPNTISFDYTNDSIANTVTGQFILTPKTETKESSSANQNQQKLSFTIQNFDDSYNGESGKQLTWNIKEIQKAFDKTQSPSTGNGLPNELPSAGADGKGAAVVINLKSASTLGNVMDELCGTTITGEELQKFITNGDSSSYDLKNAKISSWSPNVANTMVFTRIVVPNSSNNGENAILYIAYSNFKSPDGKKIDIGNAAWNKNLPYFTSDTSKDLWDLKYKEPIIDLSKIDGITLKDGTVINKDSTVDVISKEASKIREYMAENYILGFTNNFKISDKKQTNVEGSFDKDGNFQSKQSLLLNSNVLGSSRDSESDGVLKNNSNVFQIHFVVQPNDETKTITSSSYNSNTDVLGIYKGFYLTGYKTSTN